MQGSTIKFISSALVVVAVSLTATDLKISRQHPRMLSADTLSQPAHFGFGRPATAAEIAILDIDIRPDGKGLPRGEGNVGDGKAIFQQKCAACHGVTGTEGPNDRLVVGDTTKGGARRIKAIGNYWPYATTVFDYIRRAMPFNQPGSLTDEEVYSLTAYLLNANGLLAENARLNAKTLPQIKMPARDRFVPDDRKDGPEIR
ncbi:cytochrome c [Dyadobacter sp. SG02]|uniref:c-type cytochrome n=1 Tax=Dyadobacter sp. SG02 TaxID=1855291 RepID=UPI0008C4A5B4|nr:cytochrome c [Dyadobacter sp. SG02]SEJ24685.1 cytochrome c [Dyadobacter sp. SG02]